MGKGEGVCFAHRGMKIKPGFVVGADIYQEVSVLPLTIMEMRAPYNN